MATHHIWLVALGGDLFHPLGGSRGNRGRCSLASHPARTLVQVWHWGLRTHYKPLLLRLLCFLGPTPFLGLCCRGIKCFSPGRLDPGSLLRGVLLAPLIGRAFAFSLHFHFLFSGPSLPSSSECLVLFDPPPDIFYLLQGGTLEHVTIHPRGPFFQVGDPFDLYI